MSNLNEPPQAPDPKKTGKQRPSEKRDAGSDKLHTDKSAGESVQAQAAQKQPSQHRKAKGKKDDGVLTGGAITRSMKRAAAETEEARRLNTGATPDQESPMRKNDVASEEGASTAQAEHYSFGEVVGTGNFGKVYHCTDSSTKPYAIKTMIPAPNDDKRTIGLQAREKEILFCLLNRRQHSKNIVEFFGSFERSFEGEDKPRICFIFEFLEGPCLIEAVKSGPIKDIGMIKTISKQVLGGLRYLHGHHIVHCDLKPENLQFKYADPSRHTIKIIDFGFSRREVKRPVKHHSGTIVYQPPEACGYEKKVTSKLDIWAFGVILWEMFNGQDKFPIRPINFAIAFERKKDRELAKQYIAEVNTKEFAKVLEFDTETWKKHPEAVPLAKGVLEKDHTSRFTAADALAIPWLKD